MPTSTRSAGCAISSGYWCGAAPGPARPTLSTSYGPTASSRPLPNRRRKQSNSDIVCTLTQTREAHVRGSRFQPGQHLNAVGAPPRPDHREIDSDGIARCRVVSDSWSLAMQESGDVLIPLAEGRIGEDHFHTELGMVISGRQPGRRSATETTLFNSVGMGMQDLATARLLLDQARAKARGFEISFRILILHGRTASERPALRRPDRARCLIQVRRSLGCVFPAASRPFCSSYESALGWRRAAGPRGTGCWPDQRSEMGASEE